MSSPKILSSGQVARHLHTTQARVEAMILDGKIKGWPIGQPHQVKWQVARSEMKRAKKAKMT